MVFFFFQAEDGIRDKLVTGVQTCALPISKLRGLGGSLKSGVYLLRQDESWSDVVAALERGRGVEQRFTVREGLRLAAVAELAPAQLKIPRDSLLAAAEGPGLLASAALPAGAPRAEGYPVPT